MGMRQYLQKIATGPELSKDLSREEARDAASQILSGQADPVQAAIFLIALRMKRETMAENMGVLDALLACTQQTTAQVPEVLDIADPYDGFTRGMPAAVFLPPVLAACGVPTISNGAESVGPKYGATHRKVLKAAGLPVDFKPEEAAKQLANPNIGWAYVDQRFACPALHELVDLRSRIVKRPCLTTLEVLLGSVRGLNKTPLVTGYVHKPYPPVYTALARLSGYHSALIVRGVEGGLIPSLNQPAKYFSYHGDEDDQETRLDPADYGIVSDARAVPLPRDLPPQEVDDDIKGPIDADGLAIATAQAGLETLEGASGPMRESLVYGAAIYLCHLGLAENPKKAAARVRSALDSGAALQRFTAASA